MTDNSFMKKDVELIAFGKGCFSKCENTKSILLSGASSLDPQRDTAPVPRWGPGWPPDPLLVGVSLTPGAIYFLFISIYLKTFCQPW